MGCFSKAGLLQYWFSTVSRRLRVIHNDNFFYYVAKRILRLTVFSR